MKNIEKILNMEDEKEKIRIINRILNEKPYKKWKKYDRNRWNEKYKAIDRKHRKHLIEHNREVLKKKNLQPKEISIYPKGSWNEGKKHCSTMSEWQRKIERDENYKPEIKDLFTPTIEMIKRNDLEIKKNEPAIIFSGNKAEIYEMKIVEHTKNRELNVYKVKKGRRVIEIKCKDVNEFEKDMVNNKIEINNVEMTGKDLLEVILKTGVKIYEVTKIIEK